MQTFILCFIPLFIAVDAIGVLPIFLGLMDGVEKKKVQKLILSSILTAFFVALIFLFLGTLILNLLNITISDFMIAGGIILFIIAMLDIFFDEKLIRKSSKENIGIVPIGVPLITGPAVLTTLLLLKNEHGIINVSLALIANIIFTWLIFEISPKIFQILGKNGIKIISKITSLLLASIGVMMIRKGIVNIILNKI